MPTPDSDSLVSILIPAYNQQEYLPATLASCRAQSWPHLEVIVVDDGSTDATASLAEAVAREDARFRVIRTTNQGPCAARNLALAQSRGHWIKFLDSDDLLASDAVERLLLAARQYHVSIVCGSAVGFWDRELPAVQEQLRQPQALAPVDGAGEVSHYPSLYELNARRNPTFNEILLTRALLVDAGGFEPRLFAGEELNLYLRLSMLEPDCPAVYLPSPPVLLKRYHLTSLAVQARTQKEVSWYLRSLQYAAESYLALPGEQQQRVPAGLNDFIFDELYRAVTNAYRNDLTADAEAGWAVWQRGRVAKPALTPWYHHWLHRLMEPRQVDRVLRRLRQTRKPFSE